jgi:hypothetical protein
MLQRLTVDFRKHASAAACGVDEAPPVMVLEADVAPASEASAAKHQRLYTGHP